MSLRETKEHLIELLNDSANRVIALSGKWGTGKTHLWNKITEESQNEHIKGALYVSLFGLSSIDQVKRKLIESVAPSMEANPRIWETAKQAVNAGIKVLEGFHGGFSALNELNLLIMAPMMLREKIILIDDIERMHEAFGLDEILGFIDEYSQRHKTRFVLVLNSDQLAKKDAWDTLREKVIDSEIRLLTTPDEAFSIAIELLPSTYSSAIKKSSTICGLTNIRIIGKIIRAVNRILGGRDLDEAIQARVVPSIVLFSAIHYKGLEDGPDFQFALNVGSPDWGGYLGNSNQEPTEEEKRQDGWLRLMQELGILGCDEYESLVVEFLESGLFDAAQLGEILDRYITEKQNFEARGKAREFLFKNYWDHRISEEQLIKEASDLPAIAKLLDPFEVSKLALALADLKGGATIGGEIVDVWIAEFGVQSNKRVDDDNPFNQPLHVKIKAELDAIKAKTQANTTVLDACLRIIETDNWGTMQKVAMKKATAADFEALIRGMEPEKLPGFMRRMIDMSLNQQDYEQHFGSALERFVEACGAISKDSASPRLAGLINRLFTGTAIASKFASHAQAASTLTTCTHK